MSARLRLTRAFLGAAILAVLAGCGGEEPRPNLVLITIDTTRADRLGAYGYERETSPRVDALAAAGVRFERAFSSVPITLPAHTTIMTGQFPTGHGVRDNGRFVVGDEIETLAEALTREGYDTAAFVSAFVLESRYGLDQGFALYDDEFGADWSEEDLRDARIYNNMVVDRVADQTTNRVLEWLESRRGGPFFLWVHYYDPHQQYDPPHPYNQLFRDSLYDGEIAFMDAQIGVLLDALAEHGQWDDTAIVLTADHGESLWDHAEPTHAILAYDSTLQVPLIVKPPAGDWQAGHVVDQPVSHVDILPTLEELLDFDAGGGERHGRSLAALIRGRSESGERISYFECNLPHFGFGWAPLFGIRRGESKYIHGREPELYRLADDPAEIHNRAGAEPELAAELEELLFRVVDSTTVERAPAAGAIDSETAARLEALGYVGGSATAGASELAARQPGDATSPRDGVLYLPDYYVAQGLASRGQLQQAADIYRSTLLPLDPENPTFLSGLANLERRLGDPDAAFELYRELQRLTPDDAGVLSALGQLEVDRGDLDAARELLQAAVEIQPEDLSANYLLAKVLADRGEAARALAQYDRVLGIDASHKDSLINSAIELFKLGRQDDGRQRLARALERAPLDPRAHYNLGVLEHRSGDAGAAVAAFETALRAQPGYLPARLGLAVALIDAGERERALSEARRVVELDPEGPFGRQARALLE